MYNYTYTSDDLAKLRAKYPPGLKVAFTTTATHHKPFIGTVAWVNDEGSIIVDWDDEETPPIIISRNIVKSITDKK